jgi:hypothetical protein
MLAASLHRTLYPEEDDEANPEGHHTRLEDDEKILRATTSDLEGDEKILRATMKRMAKRDCSLRCFVGRSFLGGSLRLYREICRYQLRPRPASKVAED